MLRTVALSVALFITCLVLFVVPTSAGTFFPQTGYSVTDDRVQDYFDHRGGARVLGYPISRQFSFMGSQVQFFQRAVLQIQPSGGVGLMNLLSDDLLPYIHVNGSVFPGASPELLAVAPSTADPDYATKVLYFLKLYAPDSWEGMDTNFYTTFANTVSAEDAGVDPELLPSIDLEIWGLPTSKPAYDPGNRNFVYLRFQRGIMQYDKTSGLTQGILLGDYLKGVITGRGLPLDLANDAKSSRLYLQYNNGMAGGMNRPSDLPGTNLFLAFEGDGVVLATPAPVAVAPPAPVAPVPPTAVPVPPTAAPAPPTATVAPQVPSSIAVTGDGKFVSYVNETLNLLANKSPYNYNVLRQNVYRIEFEPTSPSAASSVNAANHLIKVTEWNAWPPEWSADTDNQREWFASQLVSNAVHIGQINRGVNPHTADSVLQALRQQQDVLAAVETTENPPHQFWDWVQWMIDRNTGWFGDWQQPQPPGWVKATPTPTD